MEKGYLNKKEETLVITTAAIAAYAGAQALECFGIVGMAAKNKRDSVMQLLKRDSLDKGINVTIENDVITIEFHVITAYGLNVVSICENLIENVKYKVEEFTGMNVGNITVFVEGVRVID